MENFNTMLEDTSTPRKGILDVSPNLHLRMQQAQIRKNQSSLVTAVKAGNNDYIRYLDELVSVDSPLLMKYQEIDVPSLLQRNCKTVTDFQKVSTALGILEKYAHNLMKPESSRPAVWREIKFSNPIFRDKVNSLLGAKDILRKIGYTEDIRDGVAFPHSNQPDQNQVAKVIADLLLARQEVDAYKNKKHPAKERIDELIDLSARIPGSDHENMVNAPQFHDNQSPPGSDYVNMPPVTARCIPPASVSSQFAPKQIPQVQTTYRPVQPPNITNQLPTQTSPVYENIPVPGQSRIPDQSSPQMLTQQANQTLPGQPDFTLANQKSHIQFQQQPSDFNFTGQPGHALANQTPYIQRLHHDLTNQRQEFSGPPSTGEYITPGKPQITEAPSGESTTDDPEQLCDICGDKEASLQCDHDDCKTNKLMCESCDKLWHQHKKRKDHQRVKLSVNQRVNVPSNVQRSRTPSDPDTVPSPQGLGAPARVPLPSPPGVNTPNVNFGFGNTSQICRPSPQAVNIPGVKLPPSFKAQGLPAVPQTTPVTYIPNLPVFTSGFNTSNSAVSNDNQSQSPHQNEAETGRLQSGCQLLDSILDIQDIEKRRQKLEENLNMLNQTLEANESRLQNLILNNPEFYVTDECEVLNRIIKKHKADKKALMEYKEELDMQLALQQPKLSDDISLKQVKYPPPVYKPSAGDAFGIAGGKSDYEVMQNLEYGAAGPASAIGIRRQTNSSSHAIPGYMDMSGVKSPGQQKSQDVFQSARPPASMPQIVRRSSYQFNQKCSYCGYITDVRKDICISCFQKIPDKIQKEAIMYDESQKSARQTAMYETEKRRKSQSEIVCPNCRGITDSRLSACSLCYHPIQRPASESEDIFNEMAFTPSRPPQNAFFANIEGAPSQPQARTQATGTTFDTSAKNVPKKQWYCDHCTFLNDANTRVCSICDRTSSNPKLKMDDLFEVNRDIIEALGNKHTPPRTDSSSQLPSQTSVGTQFSNTPPRREMSQLTGHSSASVSGPRSNKSVIQSHQEEADRVLREKREAHEKFRKQLEEEEAERLKKADTLSSSPHQKAKDFDANPNPQTQMSLVLPNIPANAPARTHDMPQPASLPQPRPSSLESSSPMHSGMSGADGQPRDTRTHLQLIEEDKQREKLAQDGMALVRVLRSVDSDYDMREIELGFELCGEQVTDVPKWLDEFWPGMITTLVTLVFNEGRKLGENNTVGEISDYEAREALFKHKGKMEGAVEDCIATRQEKFAKLASITTHQREKILQKLLQCKGDVDLALKELNDDVLCPVALSVWEGHEGPGDDRAANESLIEGILTEQALADVVKNKEIDKDRRARILLVEGKLRSWGRAETVLKLLDKGELQSDPTLEEVIQAAQNCNGDYASALLYLHQECSVCMGLVSMNKIHVLTYCKCYICADCVTQYFELQIREKHPKQYVCPACSMPDTDDPNFADTHYQFLDILLQNLVPKEVHELFQQKLRDWNLTKDPNFRWCAQCSNGFINNGPPDRLRIVCPGCNASSCFKCKKPWENAHDGLTCEEFAVWKEMNDPELQERGLARHLEENGIDCPACSFRYALAKGGCMHFTCSQCRHEFCAGCSQPFKRGTNCDHKYKSCRDAGLHCHHPRDCLFYLRDYDIEEMQKLLRDHDVNYNTDPPPAQDDEERPGDGGCGVMEQKETPNGLKDEPCGREVPENQAGLCILHYKEYLVSLINRNHIDPLEIMTTEQIKTVIKRVEKKEPKKKQQESAENYRKRITEFVQQHIPLNQRGRANTQ